MMDAMGFERAIVPATASYRTALSQAMLENQAWLAALEGGDNASASDDAGAPDRYPISVKGPGYIVMRDDSGYLFARSVTLHVDKHGQLVDQSGRMALGVTLNGQRSALDALAPLAVPPDERKRYSTFNVDQNGVCWCVLRESTGEKGAIASQEVPVGRVALAVFSAPENLAARPDGYYRATPASGSPTYVAPASDHSGTIQRGVPSLSFASLQSNLRALWMLSGHAEIEAAIVGGRDTLNRIALNLVR